MKLTFIIPIIDVSLRTVNPPITFIYNLNKKKVAEMTTALEEKRQAVVSDNQETAKQTTVEVQSNDKVE